MQQLVLEHFPVVKLGVEIIIDEELDRTLREQKSDEAAKKIADLRRIAFGENDIIITNIPAASSARGFCESRVEFTDHAPV